MENNTTPEYREILNTHAVTELYLASVKVALEALESSLTVETVINSTINQLRWLNKMYKNAAQTGCIKVSRDMTMDETLLQMEAV
jgi:hypothetical protein